MPRRALSLRTPDISGIQNPRCRGGFRHIRCYQHRGDSAPGRGGCQVGGASGLHLATPITQIGVIANRTGNKTASQTTDAVFQFMWRGVATRLRSATGWTGKDSPSRPRRDNFSAPRKRVLKQNKLAEISVAQPLGGLDQLLSTLPGLGDPLRQLIAGRAQTQLTWVCLASLSATPGPS